MNIQRKSWEEVERVWPGMYGTVRGYAPVTRNPDFVYVHLSEDNSQLLGYVACNLIKQDEVAIQFGASMPWYRAKAGTVSGLREALKLIHAEGYKYIQINVKNNNLPMLKLALHLGFLVFGLHRSTKGVFYVEMIKEAKNES